MPPTRKPPVPKISINVNPQAASPVIGSVVSTCGLNERGSVTAIDGRDEAAVRAWVEEYQDDVFRFMKHMAKHRETAEDLTQQTFIRAWKSIDKFRGESSMRVWLHAIAYREYAAWRTKHRLLSPLESIRDLRAEKEPDVEARNDIEAALRQISPVHREAFLLHEVQGLSMEEISAVTNTPVGTIKSRLHHARRRLQQIMGGEGEAYEA